MTSEKKKKKPPATASEKEGTRKKKFKAGPTSKGQEEKDRRVGMNSYFQREKG